MRRSCSDSLLTASQSDGVFGSDTGEIPVEQPTKFDLAINLTTARALGITIPPQLIALADEVIQ